ncbi:hypothetical protein ACS0TY_022552 [Phlomoides rotata]
MAVTHADLVPSPKGSEIGSRIGAFLMVITILLGLLCFILSLFAEASRSQVTWTATSDHEDSQCSYTGSGKFPLVSATVAFLALAIAMVIHHTFLLIAVSKSDSLIEITWDPDSSFARSFTWQAGFFFVATWTCFSVGEVLLLIGLSVESGHLKNWESLRPSCLAIRQGLFTSAGVFGLATVFLASGLYTTALRGERHVRIRQNTRREVLDVSAMHASPPRSPQRITVRAAPSEPRHDHNLHTLNYYLTMFDKQSSLV